MRPRIAVFGGSQATPGDQAYEHGLLLGRKLGSLGFTVLTGGYIGLMEAVSRGATEGGGHVIGVTCTEIESWRPVNPNPWVQEELRCATLLQRLSTLISESDAAVALPGGPGTLTEIALTWNMMIIRSIAPRPLILVGPEWQALFHQFYEHLGDYIPRDQRQMLSFAPEADAAITLLLKRLNFPSLGWA